MLILFCDTHELLRAAHFRNSTIHSHIAGFHPAFMLMSGAGLKVFPSCEQAPTFYDTYGLLRTSCSRNPPRYSHIVGLISHFYAHIEQDPRSFAHL